MGFNSAAPRPESPPPRSCAAAWGGSSGGDLLGLDPGHGAQVEAAPGSSPLAAASGARGSCQAAPPGGRTRQRCSVVPRKGHQICQARFAFSEAKLAVTNHSIIVHVPQYSFQEDLLHDVGRHSVNDFVELIAEAIGHLDSLLLESVNYISLNEVGKAEGILLQVKNALDEGAGEVALQEMVMKFYQVIRHRTKIDNKVSKKLFYRKQDLCQIISNVLTIHETNMPCPNLSSLAKYTLRCKIEAVDSMSYEFPNAEHQVLKLQNYKEVKGHLNLLFCVTDAWLLAVCDVALGSCLDLYEDYSLNNAPSGYNSVHGVCIAADISSGFQDDEFVEKILQIKIRYVVKFCRAEVKKSISACYWDGTGAR
ncbi:LOW QUALITY PROTEIN: protein mono-ADP-ribosyltransferase PARP4 [Ara ararauna]